MKTVMIYETTPAGLTKAMAYYEAHVTRLKEFHSRGVLVMAGPLGNPPEGALGVFTTRELLKNL
jgi:uncharacterized protein